MANFDMIIEQNKFQLILEKSEFEMEKKHKTGD